MWPLSQAAQACFGSEEWPAHLAVPQVSVAAPSAALSPSAKCGRVGGSGGVAAVRSGLFERLAGANAVAGELAAAHAESSGRRQRSRQNGEGESAGVTDATANPDEVVVVVVGLTEPAAVADDSLAPAGAHVASLFCQHVMPQFADGSGWDQRRETVADLMIDTVEAYAPGFKASVIARQSLSPLDLERTFGLPNGDIFHGAMTLDQLFSARPMLGFADYRMPIDGLYLCGSGAHPGGGVTGAPGHNAAQAIIADLVQ